MHRYSKSLIVAAVLLLTLALIMLDRTHINTDEPSESWAAQPAPDVTFHLLGGGIVALHSLKGHTVWLHFWASWCIPCRGEFSKLLTRMQTPGDDTILLAVSADNNAQDAKNFIAPLAKKYQLLFDAHRVLIAHDPGHTLTAGTFQTYQYPETIIIGPDLTMREKIVGVFE